MLKGTFNISLVKLIVIISQDLKLGNVASLIEILSQLFLYS